MVKNAVICMITFLTHSLRIALIFKQMSWLDIRVKLQIRHFVDWIPNTQPARNSIVAGFDDI